VRLVFTPHGWADYTYWLGADGATLKRINRLIDDALPGDPEGALALHPDGPFPSYGVSDAERVGLPPSANVRKRNRTVSARPALIPVGSHARTRVAR